MKVYLSVDMEGTAGIVDWEQCVGHGGRYDEGRELLLAEVNAAIAGAVDGGATVVVVNDAHGRMQNLPPERLAGRAEYVSGATKPLYMMEGLDSSFAAALFVSYHASAGTAGVLSHTYNPAAVTGVRIGGVVAGESGVNALVAQAFDVPVALITGDQFVGPEAAAFCPGIEIVQVKRALSRSSAHSLHPVVAAERIRAGARRAVERASSGDLRPPRIALPAEVSVELRTADMVEPVLALGERVRRMGERTVGITDDDPLRLFRTFIAIVALTRPVSLVR